MGRLGLKLAGVAALTAALAWIGLASGRGAGHVPAIWWANAALASVMLLNRRRAWPRLLAAGYVGNLIAHLLLHDPIGETLALSACDTGEAAIAVYGLGLALRGRVDLTRQRQLLLFLVFAVLFGPAISGVAAGLTLHLFQGGGDMVPFYWFPANALGMSVVVPLVLGLARRETRELFHPNRLANTLLYLFLVAVATTAIFWSADFPWLFFIFPPLLFLVVRLGLSGGVLGCCVVGAIGTKFTVSSSGGPLARMVDPSLEHRILILQLFLATAVLSVSVVAIAIADLRRATFAASRSEERYRELASSLETLAIEDSLTGVANRRQFDRVLLKEWRRAARDATPLTVLLLDVDRFKDYNDFYGHLEGDRCLRAVAAILRKMGRRPADLVARFGGDEFAVILPDTPVGNAAEIAERMRKTVLMEGMSHPGNPLAVVTISVGCATTVPDAETTDIQLIAAADRALYAAKNSGRNRVESVSLSGNRIE